MLVYKAYNEGLCVVDTSESSQPAENGVVPPVPQRPPSRGMLPQVSLLVMIQIYAASLYWLQIFDHVSNNLSFSLVLFLYWDFLNEKTLMCINRNQPFFVSLTVCETLYCVWYVQVPARPTGRNSPFGLNRVDSGGAIQWNTTSIPVGSSRGPSPLTIGMADTVPLAVAFTETVNAYFKGTDATK